MAFRKERALLLMGGNGAALAILAPKVLEARIAEHWANLNLFSVLAVTFVPGILAAYMALANAQEIQGMRDTPWFDLRSFRMWEVLAIGPFLTLALYLQIGTDYSERPTPKPIEAVTPSNPAASDLSPPPALH